MQRKSTLQRLVAERNGRDVEEHLRELYVERRLTDQEISEQWGISPRTIQYWRKQFGIEYADRKAAVA